MSTPTYTLINQITLATASSTVAISSIPQNYRDLVLVFDGTVSTFVNILVSANGDASNVYTRAQMAGTGSGSGSASTGTHTGLYMVFGGSGERVFANMTIMDYSQTDKHKTALSKGHTTGSEVAARSLRWPSNAAIFSLTVTAQTGNFLTGSTFSLYGIVG